MTPHDGQTDAAERLLAVGAAYRRWRIAHPEFVDATTRVWSRMHGPVSPDRSGRLDRSGYDLDAQFEFEMRQIVRECGLST